MTTDSTPEARIAPGEASAEMIEAALHARVPGGAEVWCFLPQQDAFTPHETARCVIECAINAALAATPSALPADLEAESRELLAAEYAAEGNIDTARAIRDWRTPYDAPALRAIQRALSARQIAQGVIVRADILRAAIREADRNGPSQLGQALQDALDRHSVKPPSVEADAIVERLRTVARIQRNIAGGSNDAQVCEDAIALITRLSGGEVER